MSELEEIEKRMANNGHGYFEGGDLQLALSDLSKVLKLYGGLRARLDDDALAEEVGNAYGYYGRQTETSIKIKRAINDYRKRVKGE